MCKDIYMYMYVNKASDFRCSGWDSNPRQEGALPAELTKQLNWLSLIQDRRAPSIKEKGGVMHTYNVHVYM